MRMVTGSLDVRSHRIMTLVHDPGPVDPGTAEEATLG
ncbi:hypothetical protein SAMN06264855_10271 [Halorubrum vacuolatum]|uniref:Uncharacterized protein n=1 Tax=Halorubrum vacuolatum TaxID=63740 RepID=A0A238V8E1_HALVU|nr:hypothetical protein SAMN06264855_10271 [Halorubrum vacuolatum]